MNAHQRRVTVRDWIRRGWVHAGPPPEAGRLVALSTLPVATWVGRRVYGGATVVQGIPYWRSLDAPAGFPADRHLDARLYRYDVATVTQIDPNDAERVYYMPVNHVPNPENPGWLGFNYPAWAVFTLPEEA